MNRRVRAVWWLLVLLCLCFALYSAVQIGSGLQQSWQADQLYRELSRAARFRTVTLEELYLESGHSRYISPIDFASLWEVNPDIVGWLSIEGTEIDYPIVQGGDNEAYLHMTVDGQTNTAGAIFVDCRNSQDFTDRNTIVYGHKMRDGSMFGALTEYKSQAYLEAHPEIMVYLPETEYRYVVVSAYVTDAVSDTYTLDMDEALYIQYLRYIRQSSVLSTEQTAGVEDRLITLSTCDYTYDDARMVVHGVLVQGK